MKLRVSLILILACANLGAMENLGKLEKFAGEYCCETTFDLSEIPNVAAHLYDFVPHALQFNKSGDCIAVSFGGKVLFNEHNQFTYQRILALAGEKVWDPYAEDCPQFLMSQRQSTDGLFFSGIGSTKIVPSLLVRNGDMALGVETGFLTSAVTVYRVQQSRSDSYEPDTLKKIVELGIYNMFERVTALALSDDKTKIAVGLGSSAFLSKSNCVEIYTLREYLRKQQQKK